MIQKIKEFNKFIKDFYDNRYLLMKLAKNDIRSRYAGSFFGIIWAFVQPLVTIFVFWFVFQFGFKSSPVEGIQFILWFICADIPWLFFNDATMSSTNCLYEYSYLVKKIKFRTSTLPIVKVISATFIHLFFIIFIWFMFIIYGYPMQLIWLQSIYYSFALFCLLIGISWIVSSVAVFFKDFSQIINIGLQIGFWLTPIFWSPSSMGDKIIIFFKLNPIYYITEGYRQTFISGIVFWDRGFINIYYWAFVVVVFVLGALIFHKLRPHFADIL